MNILVTGATGNIGKSVIKHLLSLSNTNKIFCGVRDITKAKSITDFENVEYKIFDFENTKTFAKALDSIDCVFLLRPPQISNVKKFIFPLIDLIKHKGINKIVFLSVQGAEKSSIIPHNKIEKYIISKDINYVFLRPSYFMQNLTTTLLPDIKEKNEIILPAGKTKFNWIDIENIAELAALIINNFDKYSHMKIEITGKENLNFYTVTKLINKYLGTKLSYRPLSPLKFFLYKLKKNYNIGMVIVLIMLHYLPRFSKEPSISKSYFEITGKQPTKMIDFILREKDDLSN